MVKKSKLLLALDAHKGRDYKKERQEKLAKAAEKQKKQKISTVEKKEDVSLFSAVLYFFLKLVVLIIWVLAGNR